MPVCPLCSISVPAAGLRAHVQLELRYFPARCGLCQRRFLDLDQAARHSLADHPAAQPATDAAPDRHTEAAIRDLLRRALEGGAQPPMGGPVVSYAPGGAQPAPAPQGPFEPRLPPAVQESLGALEQSWAGSSDQSLASSAPKQEPLDPSFDEAMAEAAEPLEWVTSEAPGGEAQEPRDEGPVQTEAWGETEEDLAIGLIRCRLCGSMLRRYEANKHVRRLHLKSAPRFSCRHCAYATDAKQRVREHLESHHPDLPDPDNAFQFREAKWEVRNLVYRCFGDLRRVKPKTPDPQRPLNLIHCRVCNETFSKTYFKRHVARAHFKEAMFRCLQCPYSTPDSYKIAAQRHAVTAHGLTGRAVDASYQDLSDRHRQAFETLLQKAHGETRQSRPPKAANADQGDSSELVCEECGVVAGSKAAALEHAASHAEPGPLACAINRCGRPLSDMADVAQHVANDHGVEGPPPEGSFVRRSEATAAKEAAVRCFGPAVLRRAKPTDRQPKARCAECGVEVNVYLRREHVVAKHLRLELYRCLLCPYTSHEFHARTITTHVAIVHSEAPDPHCFESRVEAERGRIEDVVRRLFPAFPAAATAKALPPPTQLTQLLDDHSLPQHQAGGQAELLDDETEEEPEQSLGDDSRAGPDQSLPASEAAAAPQSHTSVLNYMPMSVL